MGCQMLASHNNAHLRPLQILKNKEQLTCSSIVLCTPHLLVSHVVTSLSARPSLLSPATCRSFTRELPYERFLMWKEECTYEKGHRVRSVRVSGIQVIS